MAEHFVSRGYSQAVRDDGIKIEGTPYLVQDFPNWFRWNTANGLRAAKMAAEMEQATG